MKPPPFEYIAAESVDQATALLAANSGEAKLLAGGQSLMPMLNFRLLAPSVLIDINRIAGLAGVEQHDDGLRIGALTRHRVLETSDPVQRHFPVVTEAMRHVAHLAIRNRGTIGGSLSHADPAAELPMLAVLLNATITIAGKDGGRTLAAEEFFEAALTTALDDDEIVTHIDLPALPAATGWGFAEVARRHGDFALAAAAATMCLAEGKASDVRIAVMGVHETPLRIAAAEALLVGGPADDAAIDEAARLAREAVIPMDDLHASADYRRHLTGALVRRTLKNARRRAQEAAA